MNRVIVGFSSGLNGDISECSLMSEIVPEEKLLLIDCLRIQKNEYFSRGLVIFKYDDNRGLKTLDLNE